MSTDKADSLTRLDEFAWIRARVIGGKLSPALANVLGDGDYLAAWRIVAALALPVALLVGLWLGRTHFGFDPPERPLYLYSISALVVLIILSQHGAAVGMAAWTGFVAGDLLRTFDHFGDKDLKLLAVLGASALSAASLWILLVGTPQATRQLGRAIQARLGEKWRTPGTAALAHAVLQLVFVYLWCQSTPPLLQPVYLWQDMTPMTHGLIKGLRKTAWVLAFVAAYAGAIRVLLEAYTDRHGPFQPKRTRMQEAAAASRRPMGMARTLAGTVAKAAFMTFMMSSFIPSWTMALITFLVLSAVLVARVLVMGYMGFGTLVTRIPLIVRLPVALGIIAFMSLWTVSHFWDKPGFLPPLWTTVISIVICAALLPPPAPAKPDQPGARA